MSGRRRKAMARRARDRAAARRLLPPRVHAAGADRQYRLPEQGGHLRLAVQGGGRGHAHDRRRSQASRRPDRHHRRAPHLGLGDDAALAETLAFSAFLAPLRNAEWVVYAKEPFGGPQAVLAYLSRYTHRVAISNRRLIAANETGVTFKWKDYRIEGPGRYKTMTLPTYEFIRRFLMHVLPKGVHRIRHYGLFAHGNRAANIARARQLLAAPAHVTELKSDA